MTLSDRRVRSLLDRSFRCAWIDTGDDEAAGASVSHTPDDAAGSCIRGNGEHNVQLLLLTPEGQVVSGLAGFLDADAMVEELEFALDAWNRMQDAEQEDTAELLAELHQTRARELGEREWLGPLGEWEKRRAVQDHRWSARRALLDHADFRIVDMVGNSRTFFSTTRGGGSRPRIGTGPTGAFPDMPDMPELPDLPGMPPETKPKSPPDGRPDRPRTGKTRRR